MIELDESLSVILDPFGGSVKCILLSTILNDPLNFLTVVLSLCDAAIVPNVPLWTPTNLKDPLPVIGPTASVPRPTAVTFKNSSSIFNTSPVVIEDNPAILAKASVADILPPLFVNVVLIGVNAIGDCINPSITTKLFSSFLVISNWCALPAPSEVNVTAVPAFAFDKEVANLNLSELSLITKTSVGKSVPGAVSIESAVTPINVLFGVYFNFSPVLKKCSLIKNSPVAATTVLLSAGLNVFAKIGISLCFKSNSVLFDLLPFTALYNVTPTFSVTRP